MSITEEVDDGGLTANKNCPVPRPLRGERFVMLGFYQAKALADHSVAGLDKLTTTGEIRIGPGPGNLFLVLLTPWTPIIYRFSGHVDRLSRLVVLSTQGAAVTGVKPSKITFGMGEDCSMGYRPSIAIKFKFAEAVFGRNPDDFEEGDLYVWTMGAGGAGKGIEAPERDYDYKQSLSRLEENFESIHPGGLVKIDPNEVISLSVVEKYRLLPNAAGVVQLERAGKIVRSTRQEIEAWHARARQRYGKIMDQFTVHEAYKVLEPVDLPAAMCGGHLLHLLLPSEDYVRGPPCHNYLLLADGRMMIADWSKKQDYVEKLTPLEGADPSR